MRSHYIEIVTEDVAAACALYEAAYGVAFGAENPDLGGARTASRAGLRIGVRAPLAAHDTPIVRVYVSVDDIAAAVDAAKASGAVVAYGPAEQGDAGTFAIVFAGGVQHGFWQAPLA